MTFVYTPPKLTEKRFMDQVIALAELLGWRHWHDVATNAPRTCKRCKAPLDLPRNPAGFPDLILIRRPRIVWAELKAERTRATRDQIDFIAELRASGQEAYIWHPSDWPKLERILARPSGRRE